MERTLRETLGERTPALLARLERAPIAVASIAQVHRATLPDGTEVAVKVRHAGIEAALTSDLKAASMGSSLATGGFGVAGNAVKSFVDEARAAFLWAEDVLARTSDRFPGPQSAGGTGV